MTNVNESGNAVYFDPKKQLFLWKGQHVIPDDAIPLTEQQMADTINKLSKGHRLDVQNGQLTTIDTDSKANQIRHLSNRAKYLVGKFIEKEYPVWQQINLLSDYLAGEIDEDYSKYRMYVKRWRETSNQLEKELELKTYEQLAEMDNDDLEHQLHRIFNAREVK